MRSGVLLPPQRRPTPGALYVGGVGLLAAVLLLLADAGIVHPALIAVVAIPLGPLGLLGAVVVVALGAVLVPADGSDLVPLAGGAALLAAVLLVAAANVLIAARVAAAAAGRPVPARYRGRVPVVADRLLGGSAFLTAGALLVVLSFLAGFTAVTAGGIDVPTPVAEAAQQRLAALVAWLAGLVAAIAGLVLWVAAGRRGTAMLRWALADLGVQVLSLGGLIAVLAVPS